VVVQASGTSPNICQPNSTAHTISVYWNGTTTLASASLSARTVQNCDTTEEAPTPRNTRMSYGSGVTHPNGAATALSSRMPRDWYVISTVESVSRSARVVIISSP